MNNIPNDSLPVIFKIISDAETELTKITGFKVKLKIENLGEIVSSKEMNRVLLQKLISDQFNISWKIIMSADRKREIVEARRSYCFIATNILGQTLVQTGKDIGRDHTSVIHLRNSCRNLLCVDAILEKKIDTIKTKLYENIN